MRTEVAVVADTAQQMAWAATRYRLARPALWVPLLVELALGAVFVGAGQRSWGLVLVLVALAQPLVMLVQTNTLANTMRHRGFRPGTLFAVDWEAGQFTVSAPAGSATYPYDAVTRPRQMGSAVAMRIRGARVLLVLPAAVVPAEARPRLRLPPRP